MKFSRDNISALTIRRVEPGTISIGDETVTEDVILFRDTIRTGWRNVKGSPLSEENIAELIADGPEIIIFGAGWRPAMPPRELVFTLARKGIGFETMDTPAACRTFNVLISEGRDVAAVLLVKDGP